MKICTHRVQLDPIPLLKIQMIGTFHSEYLCVFETDTLSSMEFSRTSLCLLTKSYDVITEVAVVRR